MKSVKAHSVVYSFYNHPFSLVILAHHPCSFGHFDCSSPVSSGASEGSVVAALENVGMTAASVYHFGYNGTPLEAARACMPIDPSSETVGWN